MYGIKVRNTGMWGCVCWCKRNGEIELYATMEEAALVAERYNENQRTGFNHYWAEEYA